ncbi:TadE/TadG family type IV pilus assembly protein [Methylobacterium sp. SyP6R]|uniref:TadE/TadG family type IV pilus assembly protein n=1 Tax=Methylobacterium sp. SyP6R TaxID=2718876 RepID=UPI001F45634A|nr:TadE family protein [Methylobacterium sp. SyP6R]MCF4126853.1 pilus assembly protein [Methylobacterium sp. SyP6R]
MRDRVRLRLRRFRAADDGLAAVEAALILPVLLVIMLGGIQLIAYINAVRKVELVVQSISQMISQTTPPSNGSTTVATVNASDLHYSFDSALVLFPYVMGEGKRQGKQWWQVVTINYASIQFTQIATTCSDSSDLSACYRADVVWTSTGTTQPSGGPAYRPCGTPQIAASNTADPTPQTLPRSLFGPASMVVIDVVFTFNPTFGASYLPSLRIARSAYIQPRYASLINFDTNGNDGIATKCPGF